MDGWTDGWRVEEGWRVDGDGQMDGGLRRDGELMVMDGCWMDKETGPMSSEGRAGCPPPSEGTH